MHIDRYILLKINNFFNKPPGELLYVPDIDFSAYTDQSDSSFGRSFASYSPMHCKAKRMDYLSLMWSECHEEIYALCQKYLEDTPLEAMVQLFQDGADLENWCFPVKSISDHRVKSFFESEYGDNSHIIVWRTWFHDIEYNGDIYNHPSPLSAKQHVYVAVSVGSKVHPIGLARGTTCDVGNFFPNQDTIKAMSTSDNGFVKQTYQELVSTSLELNLNLNDLISLLQTNKQASFTYIDNIYSDKKIEIDVIIAEALSHEFSCSLRQRKKSVRESSNPLFPNKTTSFSMDYYVHKPAVKTSFEKLLDETVFSPDEIKKNEKLAADEFDRETEFVTFLASYLGQTCVIFNGKKQQN